MAKPRHDLLKVCLQGVSLICLTAGLAACGGGGTESVPRQPTQAPPPPPPPPPPSPPSSEFDTTEFRGNYGLDQINSIPAYEAGGTGNGVVVGVIDSGIDIDHIDLTGRIHPASIDLIPRSNNSVNDEDSHGTQVSGVIAANKNDLGIHGVAFESQVLMVRADDDGSCSDEDGCMFRDFDIAQGIDHAVANGARIINLSLGGDDGFSTFLLNAVINAINQGVLVVVSAGNDSLSQPSSFAEFALDPRVRGGALIVGATDELENRASFSNMAGTASEVFLVAPGRLIRTTTLASAFTRVSGTSFAAPHVAGAAAVLLELFPNLTGREIVQILLSSAKDLGVVGVDAVFGHGLVDLGAAIQPQGETTVSTAGSDTPQPTENSGTASTAAFGDALSRTDAFRDVIMTDRFNRPYRIDLSARIIETPGAVNLEQLNEFRRATRATAIQIGDGQVLSVSERRHDRFSPDDALLPSAIVGLTERADIRARYAIQLDGRTRLAIARGYADDLLLPETGVDRSLFLGGRDELAPLGAENSLSFAAVQQQSPHWSLTASATHLDRAARRGDAFAPLRTGSTTRRMTLGAHYTTPGWQIGLETGAMIEDGSVLGARSSGALTIGSGATTAFFGVSGSYSITPAIALQGEISAATTAVSKAGNSLFADMGQLYSSQFSIGLIGASFFKAGDRMGLSVSQPVRIEAGSALVSVPVSMDFATETLLFADRRFSLSPSGREIDVELAYRSRIYGFDLEANLLYQADAGHLPSGADVTTGLLRIGRRF